MNRAAETVETDPGGLDQHTPGAKADAGKDQWHLILRDMRRALKGVVEVGTLGALKYSPTGWLYVPGGENRYLDALMRHISKRLMGERRDPDSGKPHLVHAAWNALALAELDARELEEEEGRL